MNQTQIVWSDQENKPPVEWLKEYNNKESEKVIFEVHDKDSLNNRFKALQKVPTGSSIMLRNDKQLYYYNYNDCI